MSFDDPGLAVSDSQHPFNESESGKRQNDIVMGLEEGFDFGGGFNRRDALRSYCVLAAASDVC
jgi:hypothetical protein